MAIVVVLSARYKKQVPILGLIFKIDTLLGDKQNAFTRCSFCTILCPSQTLGELDRSHRFIVSIDAGIEIYHKMILGQQTDFIK